MLANFFNSEDLRSTYTISFSYRHSAIYAHGFKKRVHRDLPIYPLAFPDLSELTNMLDDSQSLGKRVIMVFFRLLLTGPTLLYEIIVLFRLFKRIAPDILHVNNGGYPAALSARAAVVAAKLAGIPKILMIVNNMAVGYQQLSRWPDYPLDRLVRLSVNVFITGSEAAATRLRQVMGLPIQKIHSIHNGIAPRQVSASIAGTRERLGLGDFHGVLFGVVALMIPRKGHQVLLEAVSMLVAENRLSADKFKILIEGDGHLRSALVNFVDSHNLSSWVTFVGDEENIVNFMSVLDVLILPSVQDEDLPNVILEAMAAGKPVIASRLAGTPEQVVHGVTGLLVEPRNAGQLAHAINLLIENDDSRNNMGIAALDRFNEHFTCTKSLSSYMNLYQQCGYSERTV